MDSHYLMDSHFFELLSLPTDLNYTGYLTVFTLRQIARDSSNPLIAEAHSGLRVFCSSASMTRESNGCPETHFCVRTLCKRTLLENQSSNKYFFYYKTMDKINESVCNYEYLSTVLSMQCSIYKAILS